MEHDAIPPHKYPLWIVFFTISLVGVLIFSLNFFEDYYKAAKNLNLGELEYDKKNYAASIKYMESTLKLSPGSKKAKIEIAKAYFSQPKKNDKERGLVYLDNINLDKYEWAAIKEVMPPEYQEQFSEIKKTGRGK